MPIANRQVRRGVEDTRRGTPFTRQLAAWMALQGYDDVDLARVIGVSKAKGDGGAMAQRQDHAGHGQVARAGEGVERGGGGDRPAPVQRRVVSA